MRFFYILLFLLLLLPRVEGTSPTEKLLRLQHRPEKSENRRLRHGRRLRRSRDSRPDRRRQTDLRRCGRSSREVRLICRRATRHSTRACARVAINVRPTASNRFFFITLESLTVISTLSLVLANCFETEKDNAPVCLLIAGNLFKPEAFFITVLVFSS